MLFWEWEVWKRENNICAESELWLLFTSFATKNIVRQLFSLTLFTRQLQKELQRKVPQPQSLKNCLLCLEQHWSTKSLNSLYSWEPSRGKGHFLLLFFFFWVPTFFLYSLEISLLIMSTSLGESNLSTICRCFDVNKYMIVTISVAACWWHYWWARSLTFDCRLLVWLPIVYWWTGSLLIILLSMLIVMASGGMLTADRGIEQVHCWLYHRTCLLFVDYWYANRHLHFQHSLLIV